MNSKFTRVRFVIPIVVLAIIAAACGDDASTSSQEETQAVTETYSQAAIDAVPYPLEEMNAGGWLERRNIRERLIRYADANKISYIYFFTESGQLMSFYTVKGKVSVVSSQLTTSEVVTDGCGAGSYCAFSYAAPLDDGTWGPSEDAIFFFTTDGVMVQTNNPNYFLADAPLNMTSAPLLVYVEGSEPTSGGDTALYGGG